MIRDPAVIAVELDAARRDLARLEAASERAMEARAALPPGSTRARVTTANARWAQYAAGRDRAAARVAALIDELTAAHIEQSR